jgi:hypothetical protein
MRENITLLIKHNVGRKFFWGLYVLRDAFVGCACVGLISLL